MLMEQSKMTKNDSQYPNPRELALSNQWLPRLRTQTGRRLLACVTLFAVVAFVASVTLGYHGWALGLTILYLIGNALLRGTTRSILEFPSSALDERMVAVRNEQFRTAYRVVTAIFVVTLALPVAAIQWIELPQMYLIAAILGFFGLLWMLPSALFAWTEPEI